MRHLLILCLLLSSVSLNAQFLQGTVRDSETGKLLEGVLVVNNRTQRHNYTNDSGYYMLQAEPGDTVVFLLASYHTLKKGATQRVQNVTLARINYSLTEVEILPEMEKYEREHNEMLKTYNKTFEDASRKVKVIPFAGTAPGFTAEGLISDMASRISGQKKRDKRFARNFRNIEEQKYIAIRYNPEVVMSATKTTNDSAVAFINDTPMEKEFAMEASSLELLMWIRHHFSLWAKRENQPVSPAERPD